MQAGVASRDITPDRLLPLSGQMHVRIAEYTHDPLMATAVAFSEGETPVVLVSSDLAMLTEEFTADVKARIEAALGLAGNRLLLAATHTHLGPVIRGGMAGEPDPDYLEWLATALVEVVKEAIADLEEARLFSGEGYLEELAYNRRGYHKDGRVDMYHGSWYDDFAGVEGPRDGRLPIVFVERATGGLKAIISSFAIHPNTMEQHCYYSADLVGSTRAFLERNLGPQVKLVYLTGAAGNQAPSQLENNPTGYQPWREESGWQRAGVYLGAEILKTMAAAMAPMDSQRLSLAQAVVPIPIRQWPESLKPEEWEEGGFRDYFVSQKVLWPELLATRSPWPTHINVLRLGDAVICTNPAELYVEHGIAIKDASPAAVTLISQLTDGYVGYVPTAEAFLRGGYSTWPAASSLLAPEAGGIIVETTRQLLQEVFS